MLTWIPNDANIVQIPVDENVEPGESVVLPAEIIEHFIREAGAVYIMNYCPCRDVTDCKDYPRDIGCMWIGGGVRDIAYAPEVGYLAPLSRPWNTSRRLATPAWCSSLENGQQTPA